MKNENSVASKDQMGVALSVGVVLVIVILLIPIPAWIIDFGLTLSFGLSIIILMISLWIARPIEFTSFPTLLLIATILRLSLNIATTRLILAHGAESHTAAGYLISSVSAIVMGGDFIIGIIVFLILIVINFMVITKGATRIAEVGARFTLDAIPGKQMAIDADLSAGIINEGEAKLRRRELEEESSFFGAMDGASKFVRGDAIAGLLILAVNMIGGVLIGVGRHNLDFGQSLDIYIKLSVGDGLVTQIPALIISLAAGLLVSKGGSQISAQSAIVGQLTKYPQALWLSGCLLGACSIAPGFPFFPFFALGLATTSAGFLARAGDRRGGDGLVTSLDNPQKSDATESISQSEGRRERLKIVFGRGASVSLLHDRQSFLNRIERLRIKIHDDFGVITPGIEIVEDLQVEQKSYHFVYQGSYLGGSELRPGEVMVLNRPDVETRFPSEKALDPAYGYEALWIAEQFSGALRNEGIKCVNHASIILTHLNEVLRDNMYTFFTYEEFRHFLDAGAGYKKLVDEIIPNHITTSAFLSVMRALLAERVPLKPASAVLEAIIEAAPLMRRVDRIVDYVRIRIGTAICSQYVENNQLKAVGVSEKWEEILLKSLKRDERGEIIDFLLDPALIQDFQKTTMSLLHRTLDENGKCIIIVRSEIRNYVRLVLERIAPYIPVVSNAEVGKSMRVVHIGTIG